VRTVDECPQLFGGYGYIKGYPISRMFIDFRIQKIYGGTNEMMKLLIARSLSAELAISRRRAFTRLRDDEAMPLICPTCQATVSAWRRPPPTLHGVVFDILRATAVTTAVSIETAGAIPGS